MKKSANGRVTLSLTADLRDNISIAHFTGTDLWLASDETASLERLAPKGQGFAVERTFALSEFFELPAGPEKEVDVEGVTSADGYLWLVGSHSLKRRKPKSGDSVEKAMARLATVDADPNRYLIGRIPLAVDPKTGRSELVKRAGSARAAQVDGDGEGNDLMRLLQKDPHLGPFLGIPGKDNGFDVEGLAAAPDGRLFLGLRGPVLRGYAMILSFSVEEEGKHHLGVKRLAKHFLKMQGLGVRDLCVVGDDLLVLAGPTMTLSGMVGIFRVKGGMKLKKDAILEPELLTELSAAEGNPEGLALVQTRKSGAKVLVTHDSPGKGRKKGDAGLVADLVELKWK